MTTPEEPVTLDLSPGLSAYRPISRATSLEVSLPGSMAYQTRQALLRLRQEIGSPTCTWPKNWNGNSKK